MSDSTDAGDPLQEAGHRLDEAAALIADAMAASCRERGLLRTNVANLKLAIESVNAARFRLHDVADIHRRIDGIDARGRGDAVTPEAPAEAAAAP